MVKNEQKGGLLIPKTDVVFQALFGTKGNEEILGELLENLDYKMELDFCIKITTEKLFGFQGDFTPKEEVNILNALEDLEKVFNEVKEMDKEESKIHFEVLSKQLVQ